MNIFISPEQSYWDNSYESRIYSFAEQTDPLYQWLNEHIPVGKGDCLEVGICPGRYSQIIASKGYTINGIDNSKTIFDLEKFLIKSKILVSEMIYADFLNHNFDRKFQIVTSLGFIEHFKSWRHVISKMADLVSSGGYFVCEVPNFASPIQLALRQELDQQNLKRHNLESMNLQIWSDILVRMGFSISYRGAFGGFDFWVDNESRTNQQMELLRNMQFVTNFLRENITVSDISYSPYIGIIARKD